MSKSNKKKENFSYSSFFEGLADAIRFNYLQNLIPEWHKSEYPKFTSFIENKFSIDNGDSYLENVLGSQWWKNIFLGILHGYLRGALLWGVEDETVSRIGVYFSTYDVDYANVPPLNPPFNIRLKDQCSQ